SSEGFADIVDVLLDAGADPTVFDQNYGKAIQAAARAGREDIIRKLADRGCEVNAHGGTRGTALVGAASAGQARTVEVLFELGVPKGETQDTSDALVAAASKDHANVVEVLVSFGANLNSAGILQASEWLPLQFAANKDKFEVVTTLLRLGADPNAIGGFFGSILMAAADTRKANCQILVALIIAGADVDTLALPEERSTYPRNLYGESIALSAAACNQQSKPSNFCSTTTQIRICNVTTTARRCKGRCAGKGGNEATIRLLVEKGAHLSVDRDDSYFKSALHTAAFYGMTENTKTLLDLGSDVNLQGGRTGTPLQAAATRYETEVMALLLDAGDEINEHHVRSYGSALVATIVNSKHDAVKLLLERGANPSLAVSSSYHVPIIATARLWENAEEVQLLIDAGADVNSEGGKWHTALQAAAVVGNATNMRVLLDAGAHIDAANSVHGSALAAAYMEGYFLCTGLLWERGISNKLRGGMMVTPLLSALSGPFQTLITFLIKEHHADPNEHSNNFWGSPLHYCLYNRRTDADVLVDLFLEHGADPSGIGPAGLGGYYGTPLNAATAHDKLSIMKVLLDKGADPNICGNKQGSNLYWRQAHCTRTIDRGADLEVCNQGGYGHSVQSAAIRAREDVVRFLIKQGAKIHVMGGRFGTVLQAASIRCSKALIDFLLHKGCKIDEQGGRYRTALQAACAAGNKPVVLTLLEHKANVNITGGRFGSALQAACVAGDPDIVRMLVERGADIHARGGYYDSPFDAAARHGKIDVLRYLLRETDIARTSAETRHNHFNRKWFDRADNNIQRALNANSSEEEQSAEKEQEAEDDADGDEDNEAEEQQEPPMNIESIPQYDPTAPASDPDSSSSTTSRPSTPLEAASHSATSETSESTKPEKNLPMGKKARRRLARKEINKVPVKEDVKKVQPEEKEEDLSALSWLQVECGYGGDLHGPGR
ncbi:MAG: hypothetical protein Q9204_003368, partial [Flavoplaca sp. TL-2023a]